VFAALLALPGRSACRSFPLHCLNFLVLAGGSWLAGGSRQMVCTQVVKAAQGREGCRRCVHSGWRCHGQAGCPCVALTSPPVL
jgi:hypothetical protein